MSMSAKKGGTKKSSKKAKGKAKTKRLGASSSPNLTTAGAAGALLFGPEATPSLFSGLTHYQSTAVFLQGAISYLLVMYRPQGNYSPADVGAAASYFSQILGKP